VHVARPAALNKTAVQVPNEKNVVTHTHNKNVARTNPSHMHFQVSPIQILEST